MCSAHAWLVRELKMTLILMIQQPTEEFYDGEHSIITYALLSRACPDPDKR